MLALSQGKGVGIGATPVEGAGGAEPS